MDILGIGPMELILILLIALMVFGPDKLPEIGAKLGKSMRTVRQATREFSREVDLARQAVEAPINEIKQPLDEIKQPFNEIKQPFEDLKQPFKEAVAPISQLPTQTNAAIASATAEVNAAFEPAPGEGEARMAGVPGSANASEAPATDSPATTLPDGETPTPALDPVQDGGQGADALIETQPTPEDDVSWDPSQLASLAIGVINPQEALRQVIARQLRPVSEA